MSAVNTQRINLFPNARLVESGKQPSVVNASVSYTESSGLVWVRFDVISQDDASSVYFHNLPTRDGVEYVFRAKVHANHDTMFRIFEEETGAALKDVQVNDMDSVYKEAWFTASSERTGIRFSVPQLQDGYLMFTEPQLELASTYDAAKAGGGASVLRLGHHAPQLTGPSGRVVPDDHRAQLVSGPVHAEHEDGQGDGERDLGIVDQPVPDDERHRQDQLVRGRVGERLQPSARCRADVGGEHRRVRYEQGLPATDRHGHVVQGARADRHHARRGRETVHRVHSAVGRESEAALLRAGRRGGGLHVQPCHPDRNGRMGPDRRTHPRMVGRTDVRLRPHAPTLLAGAAALLGVVA